MTRKEIRDFITSLKPNQILYLLRYLKLPKLYQLRRLND